MLSQTETHDPRHGWLKDERIPFVSFGRVWKESTQPGPYVDVDGAGGCAMATRHLYDGGRRQMGPSDGRGRRGWRRIGSPGWRDACVELGLPVDGLAVHCVEDTFDEGARGAGLLLDASEPVDAIVALSDVLALGAMRELNRRGLAAGTDVALTGFDDSPLASVVSPALTTVRQPIDLIANELINVLTGPAESDEPTERLLQPELIVRGSSAPG